MAVKLNEPGYARARRLIEDGQVVLDERDAWSEHQPSTGQENEFIAECGIDEYRKWHLGIDDEEAADRKARTAISSRSTVVGSSRRRFAPGSTNTTTSSGPAAHLHGMLDALKATQKA